MTITHKLVEVLKSAASAEDNYKVAPSAEDGVFFVIVGDVVLLRVEVHRV